jgi:hypothetical protein
MTTVVLEELEAEIAGRAYEAASRKLLLALQLIDIHHGSVGGITLAHTPPSLSAEELELLVAARLAQAIGTLFADPGFSLSDGGFFDFITRQRWIGTIFAATPLRNADHVIRALGAVRAPEGTHLDLEHPALLKACVLYTLESDLSLDVDELWYRSPRLCASLLMALLSPRMNLSVNGHHKRELILGWLPSRLDQLQTIAAVPEGFIHDVWMHCSYALRDDKHAVKAPLNRLIRRRLLESRIEDLDTEYLPPAGVASTEKPPLVVIMEWFHGNHSVYRTHSKSLIALKAKYRLIGYGLDIATDEETRAIFDEFVLLQSAEPVLQQVSRVVDSLQSVRPQVIYYLGIGMFPYTIYLSNLRLAPIQCVALGHAASTFSPQIDYFLIEQDFIGDPACYSEKIISLESGAMPFVLPRMTPSVSYQDHTIGEKVRVLVAASLMKFNAVFLEACARAVQQSPVPLQFVFIPAFSIGLSYVVARSQILRFIPDAEVHQQMPFARYLEVVRSCDMFVNPFPYGNMNTIVDTLLVDVPGICYEGQEPHAAIDKGIFSRIDHPRLVSLKSVDSIVSQVGHFAAALKDSQSAVGGERFVGRELMRPLFEGDSGIFVQSMSWLEKNHPFISISPKKVFHATPEI